MRTRIIESCVFVSLRSGIHLRCPTNKEEKVSQIKGPAIFLAQFAQDVPPYNTLPAITEWAVDQMTRAIKASRKLGLNVLPTFSGALLWHTMYPWPQRPQGLVDMGFKELAKKWQPLLNVADEYGVDLAFEIHPGEDLHDGVTFERFLAATGNHPRARILYDPSHFVLQCLDYIGYLDAYKDHIKAFHVKDAEYHPSSRSGVYGGYQDWKDRPGRFRSAGDGQVDFKRIFSTLTQHGFTGWAVLEWECCIKDSVQGAREGAEFIRSMLIDVPTRAFDDFAGGAQEVETNYRILGLQPSGTQAP